MNAIFEPFSTGVKCHNFIKLAKNTCVFCSHELISADQLRTKRLKNMELTAFSLHLKVKPLFPVTALTTISRVCVRHGQQKCVVIYQVSTVVLLRIYMKTSSWSHASNMIHFVWLVFITLWFIYGQPWLWNTMTCQNLTFFLSQIEGQLTQRLPFCTPLLCARKRGNTIGFKSGAFH